MSAKNFENSGGSRGRCLSERCVARSHRRVFLDFHLSADFDRSE